MTIQERLDASIKIFQKTQYELQQLQAKSQELNTELLVLKGSIETLQELRDEDDVDTGECSHEPSDE